MRKFWRPSDIIALRRLYPNMENSEIGRRLVRRRTWSAVQNKAVKLGLRKSPEFMRTVRLPKGHTPWNKGTHWEAGGKALLTRFKKGNRPQSWKPLGTERVTRDGTLERKVSDSGRKRDWKPVKDIIWEAKRGRIRRGWFVVHKDRNRNNFKLSNLALVDRAENMRRNTYQRYPKEIARLIQLRGALNRQINKRANREEQAIRP